MQVLVQLSDSLDQAIAEVFDAAGAAEPGGSEAWDGLLRRWHLDPPPAQARAERARLTGQDHYALAVELRILLHVVAATHQRRLDHLVADRPQLVAVGSDGWSLAAGLRSRLLNLVDHQGAAYEAQVVPSQPASRLGGIFANAQRKVRPDPGAGWETAVVLHCVSCGCPQDSARVFVCGRCDRPVFGEESL